MICKKCGRELPQTARFCGVCGTPVSEEPTPVATQQPAESAEKEERPAPAPQPAQYSYAPPPVPEWQRPAEQKEMAQPLSVGQFMLQDLLMMIPVANIILLLLWAFSDTVNPNRRNWARAGLVWMGIGLGFTILVLVLALAV